ncbi:MAG: hypothetical protein U9R25_14200 [Chloroflexota bacterium]|nr:hypothetical protein [Chloroflexota bacterium]
MQRLEDQWTDGRVVTLDVMDPQIRRFAEDVGFEVTPTFILYDAQGNELNRWVGKAPALEELTR